MPGLVFKAWGGQSDAGLADETPEEPSNWLQMTAIFLLAVGLTLAGAAYLGLLKTESQVVIKAKKTKKVKVKNEDPKKASSVDFAKDLVILNDRQVWTNASRTQQGKVIQYIGVKLSSGYEWVETREYDCNQNPGAGLKNRIATFRHLKSGLLLNPIPGGSYQMGSNGGTLIESPADRVKIKAMLIGRYEVRQSCWDKIGVTDGRKSKGSDLPIGSVSLNDC
jgi:formylglycine-generating enzyme required for sulfatase activity